MAKALKVCFCGCGGMTKSSFVPGHDARFHGNIKKAIREELDAQTVLDSLPHDEARQAFWDYSEKIMPQETARKEAKVAAEQVKAAKLAAKAAAKLAPVEVKQEADATLVA